MSNQLPPPKYAGGIDDLLKDSDPPRTIIPPMPPPSIEAALAIVMREEVDRMTQEVMGVNAATFRGQYMHDPRPAQMRATERRPAQSELELRVMQLARELNVRVELNMRTMQFRIHIGRDDYVCDAPEDAFNFLRGMKAQSDRGRG